MIYVASSVGFPSFVVFLQHYLQAFPDVADVDGDDDLDLVVGVTQYYYFGVGRLLEHSLAYFENDGGVFTQKTGALNPFVSQ